MDDIIVTYSIYPKNTANNNVFIFWSKPTNIIVKYSHKNKDKGINNNGAIAVGILLNNVNPTKDTDPIVIESPIRFGIKENPFGAASNIKPTKKCINSWRIVPGKLNIEYKIKFFEKNPKNFTKINIIGIVITIDNTAIEFLLIASNVSVGVNNK